MFFQMLCRLVSISHVRLSTRLCLEEMETRTVPAKFTWTGGAGNSDWNLFRNWELDNNVRPDRKPGAGDDVHFDNAAVPVDKRASRMEEAYD